MAEFDDRGGDVIARAKSAVSGPAIALILTGVVSMLVAAYSLISIPGMAAQFDAERKKIDDNAAMPPDQKQMTKDILDTYQKVADVAMLPICVVAGLIALVTVIGGVKMRGLTGSGLTKTGAILSMVPCISGCCILGLPIGIWVLITLGKPEVKAGYRAVAGRPAGPADDLDRRDDYDR
jgi:hypothetical protein